AAEDAAQRVDELGLDVLGFAPAAPLLAPPAVRCGRVGEVAQRELRQRAADRRADALVLLARPRREQFLDRARLVAPPAQEPRGLGADFRTAVDEGGVVERRDQFE